MDAPQVRLTCAPLTAVAVNPAGAEGGATGGSLTLKPCGRFSLGECQLLPKLNSCRIMTQANDMERQVAKHFQRLFLEVRTAIRTCPGMGSVPLRSLVFEGELYVLGFTPGRSATIFTAVLEHIASGIPGRRDLLLSCEAGSPACQSDRVPRGEGCRFGHRLGKFLSCRTRSAIE